MGPAQISECHCYYVSTWKSICSHAFECATFSRLDVPPLSVRLRKLWAERGDFSRFKASTILAAAKGEDDDDEEDSADAWNFGANLNGLVDDAFDTVEMERYEDKDEKDEVDETTCDEKKDVMSIQDMLELRSKMMEKLATAQNALYFSHALVSLLLNSAKADFSSASNPSAVARAGSPHSNSAGGVAPGRGDTTAASTSAVQRNTNALHVMGSAANLEAELGIESNVFGASRLEVERKNVEPRGVDVGQEDDLDNVDDDDEEEDLEVDFTRQKKEDRKLNDVEREERGRDLVDCFQAKKQGIDRAVAILRSGASALRGSGERNQQEKLRWQILLKAKRSGWNLTPDKPVRGTANSKRELLEDGNRSRDEPARDAWIGYAIPEAHAPYRKGALAYVSHDIKASSSASMGKALAFASRPRKHLRVTFVIGADSWSSDKMHLTKFDLDTVDGQLRQAQIELADVELFDAIVGECRATQNASLFVTTINSEDSISISLGGGVQLSLEMVKKEEELATEEVEEDQSQPSAIASAALALLHLSLARQYRARDDVKGVDNLEDSVARKIGIDAVHTPLLLPILGPLHFAKFLSHLRLTLDQVKEDDPSKDYELHGIERIRDCRHWTALLLQGSHEWSITEALALLGGSATVYCKRFPVAFLTISYPSKLTLSLPMKRNSVGNRGVYLSHLDLRALRDILKEDLQ